MDHHRSLGRIPLRVIRRAHHGDRFGHSTTRVLLVLVAAALAVTACSDATTGDTPLDRSTTSMATTVLPPTTPGTTAPGTKPPPTRAPPPTTAPATTAPVTTLGPDAPAVPALIVANDDGVFLLDEGFLAQLVTGGAEVAFDDGRGGLVFQRPQDVFPFTPESTIVHYLGPDTVEPRMLLVPTGRQFLELFDVHDGRVWYTRAQGDSPDTATETLRRYSLADRTVEEVATTGGWESGAAEVSVGADRIVTYWFAEAMSGFTFYDLDGRPAPVAGDPYDNGAIFCADGVRVDTRTNAEGPGCYEWPALGDVGRLAYVEIDFSDQFPRFLLVVVDAGSGEELLRLDLERPDQGWLPQHLEVRDGLVLVNRLGFDSQGGREHTSALVVDIATGARREVALEGRASFLTGPMTIPE